MKCWCLNSENIYVSWVGPSSGDLWYSSTFVTHLNSQGELAPDAYWHQEEGAPICEVRSTQSDPVMAPDSVGGVVVAWEDARIYDSYNSIYTQRFFDPIPVSANEKPELVHEFSLSQNFPNPFNPETVIEFALPTASKAALKVFDITGREVETLVDEQLTAGNHRVQFDGSRLASGVYFYSLRTASQSLTRKMVLLK
ncbi:MAG: T9SS type A sorting domain-containing protein [bacterium]|nr:T9SS type A sorting domain-containing protein [bacterium]